MYPEGDLIPSLEQPVIFIVGAFGTPYPPRVIPGFDAAHFSCKFKAIQQALVLSSNLATVFPIGAYVKAVFKLGL
jgi:hypothetical protein